MSRLLSSRNALVAALHEGGCNPAVSGKFSAPCVIIEAGDPWAGVDLSLGRRRTGRWRLMAVAGRADSEGSIEALAELVDKVDTALLTVPGVQLPTWERPFNATLGQIAYAATAATIQVLTEEGPTP